MPNKVKEVKMAQMTLMKPAPGLCQECAVDHDPRLPHDKTSFYYIFKFNMENGREPTWDDAMAHCTDEMKSSWKEAMGRVLKSTDYLLKETEDDPADPDR